MKYYKHFAPLGLCNLTAANSINITLLTELKRSKRHKNLLRSLRTPMRSIRRVNFSTASDI